MNNEAIKVIAGIRRCGKSYLLDPLFRSFLISRGVPQDRIIEIDLSEARNQELCYLFIDEIQLCETVESPYFDEVQTPCTGKPRITFYTVLNGLLSLRKAARAFQKSAEGFERLFTCFGNRLRAILRKRFLHLKIAV